MEKLALALIIAARKLRPYFQAHTIMVPTDHPLRQVLYRPELSGRLTKWSIELGEYDIKYVTRQAIKGQAVADFIAEFSSHEIGVKGDMPKTNHQPIPGEVDSQRAWVLFVDGSSNKVGSGAGLILSTPDRVEIAVALRFNFKTTNNAAEYEALLGGLK